MIPGNRFLQALSDAGLIGPADTISRVVIDLQAGHLPVIYVKYLGDESRLDPDLLAELKIDLGRFFHVGDPQQGARPAEVPA